MAMVGYLPSIDVLLTGGCVQNKNRDKAFNDAYQIELKEKMKDNWWQVRGEAADNPHGQGHIPFLIHIHIQKQVETVMPRKGQRPMLDPTCTYVEGVVGSIT